jgi:hypothetical protein
MTDEDENPWWRTAPKLLDTIEQHIRSLYTEGQYAENADPDMTAEVLRCIIIPELRAVLREAGLDIPRAGPYSARSEIEAAEDEATAKAAEAAPQALPEITLYRWYDETDLLLYIGISDNLGGRTKGHAKRSSWMEFAVRSTVERHPTRPVAERAEEAAIKTEKPLFNFQHNSSPEARRRAVEYLIERNRFDLLGLAVSRG